MNHELSKPKVIAISLPQFYENDINNYFWGKGFTDWVATKAATPLFDNHRQPRVPLNNNYYDMSKKEIMKWQADVAQKYGINGFCYYHYWFDSEHQALEVPLNNLLEWKDIDFPFCLCWVNQTWCRTWSKIKGANVWSSEIDNSRPEYKKTDGIIMLQRYGREEEWKKHFYALLPFFKDERYICKDGKPIFVIHVLERIICLNEMIKVWNEEARKNGLRGVYFIGEGIREQVGADIDAYLLRQPQFCMEYCNQNGQYTFIDGKVKTYSYDDIWHAILGAPEFDKKTYDMGMVDFDTTPRKGENGVVYTGVKYEKFYEYFKKLYEKGMSQGKEFIFVNAWNEWGEGMYLEPDSSFQYGYLEAIKKATELSSEVAKCDEQFSPCRIDSYSDSSKVLMKNIENDKLKLRIMNNWLQLKQKGYSIEQLLLQYGFTNIAVYGMGIIGRRLLDEFALSKVDIKYGIDRKPPMDIDEIPIYSLNDALPEVDAVIVSVVSSFNAIYHEMRDRVNCPILSIEELLLEEEYI